MSVEPLANYIRTHRRKAALSQDEVAFLLGCEHGTKISRYERERRTPTFETALALEAVFGVAVSELFAGRFHQVEQSVVKRAQALVEKLRQEKPSPAIMAKLSLLMDICEKECRMDS
jgi:transcriptional regulator with XRE-family HTH domain